MKQMKGCEIMKALASDFDGTLYLHDAAESYREGEDVYKRQAMIYAANRCKSISE